MVTKEKVLAYMNESAYRPMTEGELVVAFGIPPAEVRRFRRLLKELENEGDIYVTRAARYGLPERMNLVAGRLQGHPKGYGFVIPKRPGEPDVFVGAANLNGAMHNDRVVVRVMPGRNGKREGEIVKVLARANERVVGTFQRRGKHAFVVCDEVRLPYDVLIPPGRHNGARSGDKVVAAITAWPAPKRGPEGKVMEVLGPADAPGMDILALCRRFGLPEEFPRKVVAEAESVPETISEADLDGRRDLRSWTIVTIDGEDARDLDDAVSLEVLRPDRWRLGVHIADVGYYVREGGALDREAAKRGTSFYLPGMVIPMLPPRLSNGICSLNPRVDRLTMSVVMEVDGRGEVVDYEIFPSVIRTTERMTYTSVRKILRDEDPAVTERYAPLVEHFRQMERLALTLRERRFRKGAIDFNLPEAKVKLDELGRPVELYRVERSIAEQIIEEFMLITNEVVARHFRVLGVPFVYRVHERPDPAKLQSLQDLLHTLGYAVRGFPEVKPGALQRVLDQVAGKKEERLVNAVTLRSMKQARYATEQLGHFGLASPDYTHFTSPIRRYPDLLIHRIIREVLEGGLSAKRAKALKTRLPELARHSSDQERLAVEAEREAMDLKKAAYMQDKIGQVFPGIISGVTPFGMFVELENTVEGLVSMTNLTDDYYTYEEKGYRLVGQRTGKVYRLGDEVAVRVLRASVESRQIDFGLPDASI
ncbi:MAG: ribonuclease R [Thermoanaerobacterales bacterium]|nr:ribonuclease R [Bacillota bacterium]MDI6906882.1 ribonuclease R [Thermoanaerobacterales bacterium]